MPRLTRAEAKDLTRTRILDAATAAFAERGYRDATIEDIAERAELTRGAIYSNWTGKRALLLAVLARVAGATPLSQNHAATVPAVLQGLAQLFLEQLEVAPPEQARLSVALGTDFHQELIRDERLRDSYQQALQLEVLLLGRSLELVEQQATGREVRLMDLAAAALSQLTGAVQLGQVNAEARFMRTLPAALAALTALPPSPEWVAATGVRQPPSEPLPWAPPGTTDLVTGEPASFEQRSVVAFLGVSRLTEAEAVLREIRLADADAPLTIVVVTGGEEEDALLVQYLIESLMRCLHALLPLRSLPDLQLIMDSDGDVARASGIADPDNTTHVVAMINEGTVVTRAEGRYAAPAIAQSLHESQHHNRDAAVDTSSPVH